MHAKRHTSGYVSDHNLILLMPLSQLYQLYATSFFSQNLMHHPLLAPTSKDTLISLNYSLKIPSVPIILS